MQQLQDNLEFDHDSGEEYAWGRRGGQVRGMEKNEGKTLVKLNGEIVMISGR